MLSYHGYGPTGINRGLFSNGSETKDVVDAMMVETQEALQYKRQRKNMEHKAESVIRRL